MPSLSSNRGVPVSRRIPPFLVVFVFFVAPSRNCVTNALPRRKAQELGPEQFFRELSPMFPKLSFAESHCRSSAGRLGHCVGYPDCGRPSSRREGSCADGFGVCCVYVLEGKTQESASEAAITLQRPLTLSSALVRPPFPSSAVASDALEHSEHFSNPGFPSTSIQPHWSADVLISTGVCQTRLDLDLLDLPPATVFKVKLNGVVMAPPLTGNNTGQHLIINVAEARVQPARLELSVTGPPIATLWNVRLQHISCRSSLLAPDGCAQYHISSMGRLRSLSVSSAEATPYAICLRPPRPTVNLISLRTLGDISDTFPGGTSGTDSCSSFMQVPAGMGLNGEEIPTKVCPRDRLRLTYRVFGPLVLYMITSAGQRGIDVLYSL